MMGARTLGVASVVLALNANAGEPAMDIRVFTTRQITVSDPQSQATVIYELDAMDGLLQQLGKNLPRRFEAAHTEALRRLNGTEGPVFVANATRSAEGIQMAWLHGIDALPAILINDRYLIVGVRDVGQALQHLEANPW